MYDILIKKLSHTDSHLDVSIKEFIFFKKKTINFKYKYVKTISIFYDVLIKKLSHTNLRLYFSIKEFIFFKKKTINFKYKDVTNYKYFILCTNKKS